VQTVGDTGLEDRERPGGEPSPQTVRNYLIANLVLVAVTSYFSVTYFHPDEHFQVLEFLGHKLGTTSPEELPWEFGDRLRGWLQPALYYLLARGAQLVGVRDMFAIAFLLRLASGLLAWTALGCMVRTTLGWCADKTGRLVQLSAMTLLGFLPYLCVRTSSENVGCSLFTIGFCIVVDALRKSAPARALPPRVALAAGLLFGLAFECRPHVSVLVAGLLAWLFAFRRIRAYGALALAGGGVAAVLVGLVVDRWGYGEWTFPAYRYACRYVIDHVALRSGTDPAYGYLYLLPANIFAPVAVVLMVSMLLTWLRHPKHPVTWVTLPYALVFSALAHKEERFFFLMILLSTASISLGLSPAGRASALPSALAAIARRADDVARKIWGLRRSRLAAVVVADNLLGLLLLAFYPFGWCADVPFYEYVYHHVEPGAHIWKHANWSFPEYPFYRRTPWQAKTLSGPGEAAEVIQRGEPAYFVTPLPYEALDEQALGATPRLVYSEFPGWQYPLLRAAAGPALRWLMQNVGPIPRVPKAKWLTLYRLESAGAPSGGDEVR
jgi:glycosyl transferase family 22 (putative mannosyltransferase)